jgi:zinc protease
MKNAKYVFVIGIWILLFSGRSGSDLNLKDPVPADPAIKIGRLENGLTYYVKKNAKPEKRIELRLVVNAGSICESDNEQGLAHFTEHMSFNGTKNFPGNKMIDTLEEIGVKFGDDLNAYTGFDQTVYMLKVPTDKPEWIDRGFQVLGDWAHSVTLDKKEIEKERGVVVEEWRMGLGADDRMMQKYLPILFKGSKYADRLPIGKVDIIKNFNEDTLRHFYQTWYRPDLMAVIVVGDIEPSLAVSKIEEYFGKIPKAVNPEIRKEFTVPANTEPLISIVTDKEANGYDAEIMFKHPKTYSISYGDYRNMIMQNLYTGMLVNRLNEISRMPDAPFLSAGASYGSFIGRSLDVYSLSVRAKENLIDKSLDAIVTENERVRRFGFTLSELDREKKDLLAAYENSAMESDKTESSVYADEFIRNYLTRECIPGYRKEFELVKDFLPGITLDDINDMGRAWTTRDNMLVLVTAQQKEGIKIPTEKEVANLIASATSKNVEPYVDKVNESALLPVQPVPGHLSSKTENTEFGFTRLVFSNGACVLVKPTDFRNDEILFSSYSPGGTSLYPDSDIMSASFASTIVTQSGLGDYDLTSLQKKLAGSTATLSPFIGELREGVNGSCAPRDLETILQLNYLYFTGVRRDENAFRSFISRIKNAIKPMRTNPQVIFTDTLSKIVSMNSPRVVAVPTDAQIDRINLDKALSIFRDRFADAGDFTYILVGNFKVEEIMPLLEKYIGGLPSKGIRETFRDRTPEFPRKRVVADIAKNSEPQSVVAMVWKGRFGWNDRDRKAFSMLMDILSIRCRESMREDQGGVYGISIDGSAFKLPRPGYSIAASWGCAPENLEGLTRTMLNEIGKIKKRGPQEADLSKVKEAEIRERETLINENSYWLAALLNNSQNGDRLQTMDEYRSFVNSFTIKEIKSVAGKYLNTRDYVEVTLSPEDVRTDHGSQH